MTHGFEFRGNRPAKSREFPQNSANSRCRPTPASVFPKSRRLHLHQTTLRNQRPGTPVRAGSIGEALSGHKFGESVHTRKVGLDQGARDSRLRILVLRRRRLHAHRTILDQYGCSVLLSTFAVKYFFLNRSGIRCLESLVPREKWFQFIVRHPHRRNPTRRRTPPRTPDRPDLSRRHLQDRRARLGGIGGRMKCERPGASRRCFGVDIGIFHRRLAPGRAGRSRIETPVPAALLSVQGGRSDFPGARSTFCARRLPLYWLWAGTRTEERSRDKAEWRGSADGIRPRKDQVDRRGRYEDF
jgi:hypothetical protein